MTSMMRHWRSVSRSARGTLVTAGSARPPPPGSPFPPLPPPPPPLVAARAPARVLAEVTALTPLAAGFAAAGVPPRGCLSPAGPLRCRTTPCPLISGNPLPPFTDQGSRGYRQVPNTCSNETSSPSAAGRARPPPADLLPRAILRHLRRFSRTGQANSSGRRNLRR